jgi:hypothetical protein
VSEAEQWGRAEPEVLDYLRGLEIAVVETGDQSPVGWPAEWDEVLDARTATARVEAAMSRWNQGFLDLLPEFEQVMQDRLVDVLPAIASSGTPVLAYVLRARSGFVVRLGHPPGEPTRTPPYWQESVHEEVRRFLVDVHSGFTSYDDDWGLYSPAWMDTIADYGDWPDGVPDWDFEIASTRLLIIGVGPGPGALYCTSPDLGPAEMCVYFEGDLQRSPTPRLLGELLMRVLR